MVNRSSSISCWGRSTKSYTLLWPAVTMLHLPRLLGWHRTNSTWRVSTSFSTSWSNWRTLSWFRRRTSWMLFSSFSSAHPSNTCKGYLTWWSSSSSPGRPVPHSRKSLSKCHNHRESSSRSPATWMTKMQTWLSTCAPRSVRLSCANSPSPMTLSSAAASKNW